MDVPATLTVDGKKYPNVGVHFRGMSSYMGVPAGSKRSLNVSLDLADAKQRLYGYKTLNLLNSHEDAVDDEHGALLAHRPAVHPGPEGELREGRHQRRELGRLRQRPAVRQGVPGGELTRPPRARGGRCAAAPAARGGLEYLGDNIADYKRRFEIKSERRREGVEGARQPLQGAQPDAAGQARRGARPICDVDGLLWFLALDVALINCDGYWIRASDYSLYLDEKGKFHVVPHDMNEAFRPAGGPGFGGPGGAFMRLPTPGEVLAAPLQDMLRLTEEQKKQLAGTSEGGRREAREDPDRGAAEATQGDAGARDRVGRR